MEPITIERVEKLEQLERILQSRAMQGSESLKSFLKYVALKSIDESAVPVKEYTIATEVFGRSNNFSPRNDSVVRVQASRLRQKLQDYYSTEGKSDKILIELPKGHYYPVFSLLKPTAESDHVLTSPEQVTQPLVADSRTAEAVAFSVEGRKRTRVLTVAVVLLSFAAVLLALSNINLRRANRDSGGPHPAEKFGPVWEAFLQNEDPTLLVLSNPAIYRFTNPMDSEILLKDSVALSTDQMKRLKEVAGEKFMFKASNGRLLPCFDEYTGMGEAIGLANITDLFRAAGGRALLKQSRTVSPEDLRNHNVVLLGSVWVNEWSGKLPIDEHFTYTSNATIENTNPQPGEQREYGPKFDSVGRLVEDYGLITVKPNISYRNTVMVVAGVHSEGTEAAAVYLTNPDYLKNLNDHLRQLAGGSGTPRYYQALLKVAVDNGMPTTISLVAIHELRAAGN